MEITMMQMYLLVMLDSIVSMFIIFSAISGGLVVVMLIGFFACFLENDDTYKKIIKPTIWLFVLFSAMVLAFSLTPTTKQACAIIIVPKIINNEKVQQIPNKVLELGIEWLDELKPEKE